MNAPTGTPRVVGFGCRLNAFEGDIIERQARTAGLGNVIIFNSCAVTAEAERQLRQAVRKARREHPDAQIIVTGCAAQLDPEAYAAMPEVDRVLGNMEKLDPVRLADSATPVSVGDIFAVRDAARHPVAGFSGRARAFVEVQQGCDHRCTFCIIPFARGPNRSTAISQVVDHVQSLVDQGFGEVVLTGVDLCSYGADRADGSTLGTLVRGLLDAVPDLPRLRLSSLDPAAIDDELIGLLAGQPRLMPHLHLSLQSGDDVILKRMKRRHTMDQVDRLVVRLRRARPDVALGADLIAGFPTETDAMFANTLAAIDALGLAHVHVFPYSERPGTPAARMPGVAVERRRERAAILRDAGRVRHEGFLQGLHNSQASVLVEQDNAGLSEHFARVVLAFDAEPGAIVRVLLGRPEGAHISATPAPRFAG